MTGSAVTIIRLAGNGMWDPDPTLASKKPFGFNYWANSYTKYHVYGSKITAKITGLTNNTTMLEFFVTPNRQPALFPQGFTSGWMAAARPNTKWAKINPIGYGNKKTLKMYSGSAKALGLTRKQYDANTEDFEGIIDVNQGSNPNVVWYWHVGVDSSQSVNYTCEIEVEVKYYVHLYERRDISIWNVANPGDVPNEIVPPTVGENPQLVEKGEIEDEE